MLRLLQSVRQNNADRTTWKLTLQDINTTPKELKIERDCSHRQLFQSVRVIFQQRSSLCLLRHIDELRFCFLFPTPDSRFLIFQTFHKHRWHLVTFRQNPNTVRLLFLIGFTCLKSWMKLRGEQTELYAQGRKWNSLLLRYTVCSIVIFI